MIFKFSNTGRTITIKFPKDASREKHAVFFNNGWITLSPNVNGRAVAVGNSCLSIPSDKIPKWPTHGKVELTAVVDSLGSMTFRLPDEVRPARRIVRSSKKVGLIIPDPVEEAPAITLRAAVAAVNAHKRTMGDDLALDINANGELRAMLEYK